MVKRRYTVTSREFYFIHKYYHTVSEYFQAVSDWVKLNKIFNAILRKCSCTSSMTPLYLLYDIAVYLSLCIMKERQHSIRLSLNTFNRAH